MICKGQTLVIFTSLLTASSFIFPFYYYNLIWGSEGEGQTHSHALALLITFVFFWVLLLGCHLPPGQFMSFHCFTLPTLLSLPFSCSTTKNKSNINNCKYHMKTTNLCLFFTTDMWWNATYSVSHFHIWRRNYLFFLRA